MLTLSLVRTDFRKILKWGGVIIAFIIILFMILKLLLFIKELILPSAPPLPTVTFGKLSKPYFPEGVKRDLTYEIDTITGTLPAFNLSESVYKMEQRGPDILAVERASGKMSELGFDPKPQQISDFVYQWVSPNPPTQNIILNIKLSEFNLSSSYLNFEKEITKENFFYNSEPIETATRFLKTIGFYPDDIDVDKTKVEFGILNGGTITPSTRVVNSNVATVYFFQKSKDDMPIVYPGGKNSSMKLLVNAGRRPTVLDGKFSYQKILDESATYPIKSSQEAYENLKSGDAYIVSYEGKGSDVKIKNVYLALYSEGRLQEYMIPVIVFEGTENFLAYVPAITNDWLSN